MHENAEPKALASECIAELGGNDAFWKYIDGLLEEVIPKKKIYDPLQN
jgi:protein-disulfide isomerase